LGRDQLRGHHVTNGRRAGGGSVLREDAQDEIAVRQHTDRETPAVVLVHDDEHANEDSLPCAEGPTQAMPA
jgi:hypothetical protein